MSRSLIKFIRRRYGQKPPRKKKQDFEKKTKFRITLRAVLRVIAMALTWLLAMLIHSVAPPPPPLAMFAGQPSAQTLVAAVEIPAVPEQGIPAIKPGSELVTRGENITTETLRLLARHSAAIAREESAATRTASHVGEIILLLAAFLAIIEALHLLEPSFLDRLPATLLFMTISSLTLLLCKILISSQTIANFLPPYATILLMPVALAPMLASLLLGPLSALVMGMWTATIASFFAGGEPGVFIAGMAATIVVFWTSRRVRTRSRILRIGMMIGLAQALCALAMAARRAAAPQIMAEHTAYAIAGGLTVALLTLLLLPVIELAFKVSTDITLLEFCDMQHPLLKQMAIEAPGTYHHSLMVANIAEAAAEAIGANALLLRVSAYFHDVGKLVKPGFFTENIQFRDNPHDQLSPSMSSLVIISHVKEGVNLALGHKLPPAIVDAILEHHGTSLVSYFYHKASKQQEFDFAPPGAKEAQFRYPGPKPKSRENAILALADSVEAASRSLDKITPGHIANLVAGIFKDKFSDGQLDDCPITMAECNAVQKALAFALMNVLHSRISYPADENRLRQSQNTPAS